MSEPSPFNILLATIALGLLTSVGFLVVAVTARFFFKSSDVGANIDSYLQSDKGNNNPPHIPVSYSLNMVDRTGWFSALTVVRFRSKIDLRVLDDPATQLKKYEDAETTTKKELRAIDG